MNEFPDITTIARALSVPSKMKILDALMDHKYHTATELAKLSRITPQTVAYHLDEFLKNGWVGMAKSGRFHYFFLKDTNVVALLERLSPVSPEKRARSKQRELVLAKDELFRTCYDHMAGRIGVLIATALTQKNYLDPEFNLTDKGTNFFQDVLHIDLSLLHKQKRQFTTKCLDWSERQYHVGGAIGHAMLLSFKDQGLVMPDNKSTRAIALTSKGTTFLQTHIAISLE
ncbi:MAG: helix-turn-helix transcriptional regulator [Oenococcus sp.]|uniref:ArsR/SmtB family transcription factor n=1 Tax=Oenococcus TaxID=46254 RepID=UPI0021E7F04B|nr:helix-turn-helix transcriptional regulator [Oenococcus kitaharae]MCV3295845.1 ArsR family transcriptional regulator [Oenococcus kitaharae]